MNRVVNHSRCLNEDSFSTGFVCYTHHREFRIAGFPRGDTMKSKLDVEIGILNLQISDPDTKYIRGHLFAARDALLFAKGDKSKAWWRK